MKGRKEISKENGIKKEVKQIKASHEDSRERWEGYPSFLLVQKKFFNWHEVILKCSQGHIQLH